MEPIRPLKLLLFSFVQSRREQNRLLGTCDEPERHPLKTKMFPLYSWIAKNAKYSELDSLVTYIYKSRHEKFIIYKIETKAADAAACGKLKMKFIYLLLLNLAIELGSLATDRIGDGSSGMRIILGLISTGRTETHSKTMVHRDEKS